MRFVNISLNYREVLLACLDLRLKGLLPNNVLSLKSYKCHKFLSLGQFIWGFAPVLIEFLLEDNEISSSN